MGTAQVNWLAVVVAALATFLIGGVWYSPILFARVWMRAAGLTEAELARSFNPARVFGGAFVLALVMATNLALFLGPSASLGFGAFAGAAAGLGWVTASLGIIYLFERRPLLLLLVNGGYQVVAYTAMGAILGAWR